MSEHKMNTKPQTNGRMGTGEKAKNFGASMKKLLVHIKPFRVLIGIALIFAIAGKAERRRSFLRQAASPEQRRIHQNS